MSKLYFKIGSDWEEVVRLRNEIAKLKQELMSMDGTQTWLTCIVLIRKISIHLMMEL